MQGQESCLVLLMEEIPKRLCCFETSQRLVAQQGWPVLHLHTRAFELAFQGLVCEASECTGTCQQVVLDWAQTSATTDRLENPWLDLMGVGFARLATPVSASLPVCNL